MSSARIGLLLLAAWTGCGDSCACGKGGADGAAKPSSASGSGGARAWPEPGANDVRAAAARNAGGAAAPESPSWQPAPDSDLVRKLRGAKQALDVEKTYDKLATPVVLSSVLGEKLGPLKADGEASSAVREGEDTKLAIAARNYKDGNKTVRVKITDTALLPSARRAVSNRLLMLGNETVGEERGVFVRGYPAVLAHFGDQKVSRGSLMIENRYLVQVMVRGASGPDDAAHILEQLDWAKLAPKQGKIPAPIAPPP